MDEMKKLCGDSTGSVMARCLLYAFSVAAMSFLIVWDAGIERPNNAFSENSLTEICQEIILAGIVVLFFLLSSTDRRNRFFHVMFAGLFLCALVRELDSLFDRYVFDGAWQVTVTIICGVIAILLVRHGREVHLSLGAIVIHRSFGMLMCGILTVLVFSRLFGQEHLWTSLMGDMFVRSVKNAVEEGVELFGYHLCFAAAFEYWCATLET